MQLNIVKGAVTAPIPAARLRQHASLLGRLWLAVPLRVRAFIYHVAWQIAKKVFPKTSKVGDFVRKLCPGILIKRSGWPEDVPLFDPLSCYTQQAEAEGLWLVRHYTHIPVPTLYDYVISSYPTHTESFIIMSEIPGTTFQDAAEELTDEDIIQIGLDMRVCLEDMRKIPNPYSLEVCSAAEQHIVAPYFFRRPIEPQPNVAALHEWFRTQQSDRDWATMESSVRPLLDSVNPRSVFTHGDLVDHNVMVHNGRLSGIVDWQSACWVPEYWEYVNAVNYGQSEVWKKVLDVAMPRKYDEELQLMSDLLALWAGRDATELGYPKVLKQELFCPPS